MPAFSSRFFATGGVLPGFAVWRYNPKVQRAVVVRGMWQVTRAVHSHGASICLSSICGKTAWYDSATVN